jgi:hypothetical protein
MKLERDYHYNLPEDVKQKRLEAIQRRFEAATPKTKKPLKIKLQYIEFRKTFYAIGAILCLSLTATAWLFG